MKTEYLIIFLLSIYVFPQSEDHKEDLYENNENSLSASEERDDSELMEYLEDLTQNPVNINTANLNDLRLIPFLTSADAEEIIKFRTLHGSFFSGAELYMINNIPEEVVRSILPFIKTEDTPRQYLFNNIKINFRSRIRNKNLHGNKTLSQWSNYNRLKLNLSDKIKSGILTEKDEGEKYFLDYNSFYISIKELLYFNSVIIGDYYIEAGQGLLFWRPYTSPKNSQVIGCAYKKERGIIPNTGTNESGYFRGVSFEKEIDKFTIRGFLSMRNNDATIDSNVNIIKLIKDGYHRTSTEISRNNAVLVKTGGGNISFRNNFLNSGLSFYFSQFDKSFSFGKNIHGFSINGSMNYEEITFFGESAYTRESNALIAGFNITPVKGVDFITSFRKYDHDYMNMFGSGFGEKNNVTQNETGFYTGLHLNNSFAEMNIYFDQYRYPDSGSELNSTGGYDILFDFHKPVNKNLKFNLRYKLDNKDELINSNGISIFKKKIRQSLRGDLSLNYSKFHVRLRGEYLSHLIRDFKTEAGLLLMHEIKFNIIKEISLIGRISFYRTDSFQSAFYLYDSGIPGILESRSLYGEGISMYAVLKINIAGWSSVYIKYSESIKDRETVPSFVLQTEINY